MEDFSKCMPRMSQTCLSVTFSSSFLTEGYEVQQYYRPHDGQRQKQAVMTKRANSWGNVLYIGGKYRGIVALVGNQERAMKN